MLGLLLAVGLVVFGVAEGYAFAKAGLFAPRAFEGQMLFESWILMKIFMSAVGSSMVVQSVMSRLSPQAFAASRFYCTNAPGFGRVVGGCLVLGSGMALCGSGPTIVPSQIACGVPTALTILGGSLAGGALFALLEPRFLATRFPAAPGQRTVIEHFFGGTYARWALPFGLSLLGASTLLEYVFPHHDDVQKLGLRPSNHSLLPIAAGCIIGLNQLPLRYWTGHGQGGSKCVMNMLAFLSNGKLTGHHYLTNVKGAGQLLYVYGGTLLGAYYAIQTLTDYTPPEGFSFWRSFIGGALLMLGARTAGGCTCGNGISGFSELGVQSMSGAAAIFSGGIASAFALRHAGFTE